MKKQEKTSTSEKEIDKEVSERLPRWVLELEKIERKVKTKGST